MCNHLTVDPTAYSCYSAHFSDKSVLPLTRAKIQGHPRLLSFSLTTHAIHKQIHSVWFWHTFLNLATFPTSTSPVESRPPSSSLYCPWNKRPTKSPYHSSDHYWTPTNPITKIFTPSSSPFPSLLSVHITRGREFWLLGILSDPMVHLP